MPEALMHHRQLGSLACGSGNMLVRAKMPALNLTLMVTTQRVCWPLLTCAREAREAREAAGSAWPLHA